MSPFSRHIATLLLILLPSFYTVNALCEDVVVGDKHYDLSAIAGRDFRAPYTIGRFEYTLQFRICGNIPDTCPLPPGTGSSRCAMPNSGAVCQRSGSKSFCLGVYNGTVDASVYVGNLGTGLIVSYFNGDLCENCQGDPYRNTVVVIVCAQGMAGNPDDFLVEPFTPPNSRTAVSFRHQAGCVKFIAAPSTGGLSAGSVMLIIIFVTVVVYLVGGILFNKYYRKMEGREVVPNVEFWLSIPGLVKDGAMFIVNKIRGTEGGYTPLAQEY